MKPEIAVDVDAGAVDVLGADGLKRLMQHYSVWLLTARGEHRFGELQMELMKKGMFPGSHYVGITNLVWMCMKYIISPRARTVEEQLPCD
jgi:hypothetical protein